MTGLCQCGCGCDPGIYTHTRTELGIVAGAPRRYLTGHHRRRALRWLENEAGCWIWTGTIGAGGYGDSWCRRTRSVRKAHRVVYEEFVGLIPPAAELDHLCRDRACVNPDHLEPVSRYVNIQRGAQAKVTPTIVTEIRTRYSAGGITKRQLGDEYGISRFTVADIVRGRTWPNIPLPARSAA